MYQAEWEDGNLENLRIIEDYLNDQVWLEEEHGNDTPYDTNFSSI